MMDKIIQYKVVDKIFNSEKEAIEYENSIINNLELRARNLKVFYWHMRGYPGEYRAIKLINNFCHHNKFTFGKWKGRCIGEIMMIFPEYITWCIKNIAFFKMNKEEQSLYNTSWVYNIGGTSWDVTCDYEYYKDGDTPNYSLIEWEESLYKVSLHNK